MDASAGSLSPGRTYCTWAYSKGGRSLCLLSKDSLTVLIDDHGDNNVSCWVPSFCLSSSVSHFASPPQLLGPHRLCECMCLSDEDVYSEIMQQADVSALRLFEALVVTLPQTLLQTYVLICTDIGIKSPGTYRLH